MKRPSGKHVLLVLYNNGQILDQWSLTEDKEHMMGQTDWSPHRLTQWQWPKHLDELSLWTENYQTTTSNNDQSIWMSYPYGHRITRPPHASFSKHFFLFRLPLRSMYHLNGKVSGYQHASCLKAGTWIWPPNLHLTYNLSNPGVCYKDTNPGLHLSAVTRAGDSSFWLDYIRGTTAIQNMLEEIIPLVIHYKLESHWKFTKLSTISNVIERN